MQLFNTETYVGQVITKIISNRMKPKLSEVILSEQFGFLGNRQVLEAVGITQECLHTIKVKRLRIWIL